MQIVIDISEKDYKRISTIVDMGLGTNVDEAISKGTALNGTNGEVLKVVFEGMTNGEVLQAMFPNASVYEHGSTYSVNNVFNFNSTWWNAPYGEGSEDKV